MLVAMPIDERPPEQSRTGGDLAGVLGHAVDVADERADRRRDAARNQDAEPQARERSDQAGHRALAEKEPADLPARGAERAQDADLRPPFGHRNREGVVDDEHPDEQREHARDAHHDRVGREHLLELLPAARRRVDLEARAEQRRELLFGLRDRPARLDRQVDAIELAGRGRTSSARRRCP